jgi:hypothetical protein
MFVGHFAVAFAAKRVAPRLSLATLMLAAQFLDVLFPVFILAGLEHARITPGITAASPLELEDIPYSHSLVAALGWSLLFALPWLLRRRRREALVLGILVFSHYVLDVASHHPDMPLAPGVDTRLGLGLWSSVPATLIVEGALWLLGLAIYARTTQADRRLGSVGLWITAAVLTAAWLGATLGPPPPNIRVVAASALAFTAVLLPWTRAFDRARPPFRAPAL